MQEQQIKEYLENYEKNNQHDQNKEQSASKSRQTDQPLIHRRAISRIAMRSGKERKFTNIVIVPNVEKPQSPDKISIAENQFSFRERGTRTGMSSEIPRGATNEHSPKKTETPDLASIVEIGQLRDWRYGETPRCHHRINRKKKR
jgi:hypothetical protein